MRQGWGITEVLPGHQPSRLSALFCRWQAGGRGRGRTTGLALLPTAGVGGGTDRKW